MIIDTVTNSISGNSQHSISSPLGDHPLAHIEGMLAWWDAFDLSTITLDGSSVTQWDDKSGNGYNVVQATGSLQPTYIAGKGVYFAEDYLQAAGSNLSNKDLSVFAVISIGATPGTYDWITGTGGDNGTDAFCFGTPNAGDWRAGQPDAGYHSRADLEYDTDFMQDEVFTVSGHLNASTQSIRKNNTTLNMVTSDFTQIAVDHDFTVGNGYSSTGGSRFIDVTIKEILYFEELTESDITKVEDYLRTKWINPGIAFNPKQLSPLAWWDATRLSSLTLAGSNVTQWDDLSGNGYDVVQASGSLQPILTADGVRFQDDYMLATGNNFASVNTTTFLVVKDTTIATDHHSYYFGFDNGGASTTRYFGALSTGELRYHADSITPHPDTSQKCIFMLNEDGNAVVRYNNAEISNVAKALMIGSADYSIGAAFTPATRTREDTHIYEIIVFPELSEFHCNLVHEYLAKKHAVSFSPLHLSPVAWYDASDRDTISIASNNVAQWDDKSGNDYHLAQTTGSAQPAYANNTISFDGVGDYLWRAESFMYSASNTVTMFIVMESSAAVGARFVSETKNGDDVPLYIFLENASGDATQAKSTIRNDASATVSGAVSVTGIFESGTTKIYMIQDDGLAFTSSVNSGSVYSSPYTRPSTPITLDQFAVGALVRTSVASFADIDIKEIVIFHTALTDTQKNDVNVYLSDKWNNPIQANFHPVDISPHAWWDATVPGTVILNGTDVSQWNDRTGNGHNVVQATPSEQPFYDTNGTYSFISFDNTDDSLTYDVGTYSGQIGIATKSGTYVADCSYAGSFDMPIYQPFDIVMILIADSIDEDDFKAYAAGRGAVAEFSGVSSFSKAWRNRTDLTSFPVIDISSAYSLGLAWRDCSGLTSFPLLDTSSITSLNNTWAGCSSLTSFPLIDASSATDMLSSWYGCSGLTSFPLIDISSALSISYAWYGCTSLTNFPLLNTSSVTNMSASWRNCSGLTSFPAIDTTSVTTLRLTWDGCTNLISLPLLDTSLVTDLNQTWRNCSSLTTFPANMFDSCPCTDFTDAFTNTALTQTSIDNILVSINAAGTSNGTFDQSGGSAPSATGEAAITAMWSRGWTVTVTGGFQINPIAWYDASDASTISLDGSNVTQWDDKSGNANHAVQATGSNQPTYHSNRKNGLAGIHFQADYLRTASDFDFITNSQAEYFIVMSQNTAPTRTSLLVASNSATDGGQQGIGYYSDGMFAWGPNGAAPYDTYLTGGAVFDDPFVATDHKILTVRYDTNGRSIWADGVLILSDNDSYAAFTINSSLNIGAQANGTSNALEDGDIYEVIITPLLTDQERINLQTYLSLKWSI